MTLRTWLSGVKSVLNWVKFIVRDCEMRFLKGLSFIICMMIFGMGMSFGANDSGSSLMLGIGYGFFGGALMIAWSDIRAVIASVFSK